MKLQLSFIVALVLGLTASIASGQTLKDAAIQKIAGLNQLISVADRAGIDTKREKLAVRTSEIFLAFADWDEDNKAANIGHFKAGHHYSDNAAEMADLLPGFEREDVIALLDERSAELQEAIDGKIARKPAINPDWSNIMYNGDHLTYNGRPVFLADWTWKPDGDLLAEYHGQLDGFFIAPGYVIDQQGEVRANKLSELKSKGTGAMGFIFINNRNVPQWAIDQYGEGFVIKDKGGVRYTDYDIDHPGAKVLMGHLIEGFVPSMSGKNFSGPGVHALQRAPFHNL